MKRYGRKVLVLVAALVALAVWNASTDEPRERNLSDPQLCAIVGECGR